MDVRVRPHIDAEEQVPWVVAIDREGNLLRLQCLRSAGLDQILKRPVGEVGWASSPL
jgi:hypothetical protein